MPDLSTRSSQVEMMDDLGTSGKIIDITLRELEIINKWLGGNQVTINGIRSLLKSCDIDEKISIADLGCGSGDMLRLMAKRFAVRQQSLSLTGIDANPNIIRYARDHSTDAGINFEAIDIFSPGFKEKKFDIVTATLFFHHFTDDELVAFFSNLKQQVRIGIVINDIHRHWLAYYSIKFLTALFSGSEMVKHDGPVSVMRAFRKKELQRIMKGAGIDNYSIRWMWAFRWQVLIDVRK